MREAGREDGGQTAAESGAGRRERETSGWSMATNTGATCKKCTPSPSPAVKSSSSSSSDGLLFCLHGCLMRLLGRGQHQRTGREPGGATGRQAGTAGMLEANVESVCVCVTKPRHTHTDPQHAAVKWKIKGPVIILQNCPLHPMKKKRRGRERERVADDEDTK